MVYEVFNTLLNKIMDNTPKISDLKKIAVIGAGNMGHGCAMVFAHAGYQVGLYNRSLETLEKAKVGVKDDLVFLAKRGLDGYDDVEAIFSRIAFTQDMEEAVNGAGFVLGMCRRGHGSKTNDFSKT